MILRRRRHTFIIISLLLPAFVCYTLFIIIPMLGAVALSFTKWEGLAWSQLQFIGIDNYPKLFMDTIFWRALLHNFVFVAGVILIQLPLALGLAILLDFNFPFSKFFQGVFLLPRVIAFISVALLFKFFFAPTFLNGLINVLLVNLHLGSLTHIWLDEKMTALPSLVYIHIWRGFGFSTFLFLTGLTAIPRQLYDAAKIDGANFFEIVRYVTIPMLRETSIVVTTIAILEALKIFEYVFIMTGGGPGYRTEVVGTYLYKKAFSATQLGFGSTAATVLFLFILCFTVIYLKFAKAGSLQA